MHLILTVVGVLYVTYLCLDYVENELIPQIRHRDDDWR